MPENSEGGGGGGCVIRKNGSRTAQLDEFGHKKGVQERKKSEINRGQERRVEGAGIQTTVMPRRRFFSTKRKTTATVGHEPAKENRTLPVQGKRSYIAR